MAKANVLVAQSGGPSPVINASLQGVIEACKERPDVFGTVYGGWHGIEGALKEELLDLSAQSPEEISRLRITPAAGAIGSCRYKLKKEQDEDFARVIDVCKAHNIGYFFYTGGNDSMDTAHKVSLIAAEHGLDLIATGVPKTIDNDVGDSEFKLIDHTPGYGSTARYWAQYVLNAEEENRGSCPADPVLVLQAMGRKIGYIPAAARLADPERKMPLLICLAESKLSLKKIGEKVIECLKENGRCILVVSEGLNLGELGEEKDLFGHTSFSSSKFAVAQILNTYINSLSLPVPGKARYQIPGTDQRDAAIYASTVDIEEAYQVGRKAVDIALNDGNGWMATILRKPGNEYSIYYDKAPLEKVANSEREFPAGWIDKGGFDVTDDFVHYARPLIGDEWPRIPLENGLQRFARIRPVFVEKKLPAFVPQSYR